MFAPSPALVCTFEHPNGDEGAPDVALNVGGQAPLGGDTGRAAFHLLTHEETGLRPVDVHAAIAC